MNLTMLLMTLKGLRVVESLVNLGKLSYIDQVVIGRDSNVVNDYSYEIEQVCVKNNINYSFRTEGLVITSRYAVAVSWRWLIKIENFELIVLHDSLLPKYRGFSPLVNMLINGENKLGVTAIIAKGGFDVGPIISQKHICINYPKKIEKAIDDLCYLYVEIVQEILEKIVTGVSFEPIEQMESEVTYSLWRDEEDYKIDWKLPASQIQRFIDSVGHPYDGARCLMNEQVVRVIDAEFMGELTLENRDVGKVLFIEEDMPIVVCGSGLLKIKKAAYVESGVSILPLKKFRTRFK